MKIKCDDKKQYSLKTQKNEESDKTPTKVSNLTTKIIILKNKALLLIFVTKIARIVLEFLSDRFKEF